MGISSFVLQQELKLNSYSNSKLLPDKQKALSDYFEPYNEELFKLTGIDLHE